MKESQTSIRGLSREGIKTKKQTIKSKSRSLTCPMVIPQYSYEPYTIKIQPRS